MTEGVQKRVQAELEKFQIVQKDMHLAVTVRQKLDAQLNENTLVKEELDLLEESTNVYKLVGPVLVKQDLSEARSTVQKRMDYINGELKRYDGNIKELEKKQEEHRDALTKLQHQFQEAQVKAAAKS
ncbi:prefoldin subunit 6-like isoform X2 [Babylonia areolata]|uniref:prefoldin subunit 6-like isoform X2 n=1 Tax=Babylonia areolata TaxID=304850 RepID=UPI003FD055DE